MSWACGQAKHDPDGVSGERMACGRCMPSDEDERTRKGWKQASSGRWYCAGCVAWVISGATEGKTAGGEYSLH